MTKEQFEKEFEKFKADARTKIHGLEEKAELLTKGSDALERRALVQAEELAQEKRRADNLLSQRNDLQRKLDGFGEFATALGKVTVQGVTEVDVRKILQEELAKLPPATGNLDVTESVPGLHLTVARPLLNLDEGTAEGQILVLALKGKLQEKFTLGNAAKARELEYGVHGKTSTLQKALDSLVGRYKALERKVEGNQNVYSLRKDARERTLERASSEPITLGAES